MELNKSAFAKAIGRSPGRVTQLIAEGKLTPLANGKIDLARGRAELGLKLDPTQQLGLQHSEPLLESEENDQIAITAVKSGASDTTRYLKAKADERELEVEAKRRRMNADTGRWMETAPAAKAFARDLTQIFSDLEAWVQTVGQDIADAHGVDVRAATLTVRKSLHKFRAAQAARRRDEAATLTETVPELAAE